MIKNTIIGTLFFAVAAFFTLAIHWSARRQNDAHHRFERVTARVVNCRVESVQSGTGSSRTTSYSPTVTYTYTIDGKGYTADRFYFIGAGYSTYDSAKQVTDAYPVGGVVSAYYDPRDPSVAVLDRSPIDTTVLNLGTLAIWGVILGTCAYAWRRRRARCEGQPVTADTSDMLALAGRGEG